MVDPFACRGPEWTTFGTVRLEDVQPTVQAERFLSRYILPVLSLLALQKDSAAKLNMTRRMVSRRTRQMGSFYRLANLTEHFCRIQVDADLHHCLDSLINILEETLWPEELQAYASCC